MNDKRQPVCNHLWKQQPGFVTRYECIECGVEGESIREDSTSVSDVPGERGGWIHSIVDRVRRWRCESAVQGSNASMEESADSGDGTITYAVSSTFLQDDRD